MDISTVSKIRGGESHPARLPGEMAALQSDLRKTLWESKIQARMEFQVKCWFNGNMFLCSRNWSCQIHHPGQGELPCSDTPEGRRSLKLTKDGEFLLFSLENFSTPCSQAHGFKTPVCEEFLEWGWLILQDHRDRKDTSPVNIPALSPIIPNGKELISNSQLPKKCCAQNFKQH